eukprot:gb/GECG01009708.1/.p1 GENE.gb/GECG01009708.1/~~gb/GECG01009708.1/.p1  ORF type:complete len:348 (+),score=54.68 gb/GECG01009708.1/:1-1044(+)
MSRSSSGGKSEMIDLVNMTQDHLVEAGLDKAQPSSSAAVAATARSSYPYESSAATSSASTRGKTAAERANRNHQNIGFEEQRGHEVDKQPDEEEDQHIHTAEDEWWTGESDEIIMYTQRGGRDSTVHEATEESRSSYDNHSKLRECVDIVLSFLEVVIHCLLYYRAVYPPNAFERAREYDIIVFKSRFKGLTDYVKEILEDTREMLTRGVVDKVCLVILDDNRRALEQYVFPVSIDTEHQIPATYGHLRQQIVQTINKLCALELSEETRTKATSFTLLVHSIEDYPAALKATKTRQQSWMPLDTVDNEASLLAKKTSENNGSPGEDDRRALHSIAAGPLRLSCVYQG